MADPTRFLARWSRLKQKARTAAPAEGAAPASAVTVPQAVNPPTELPSIESLTAESDFSVFMQAGVPEAARNAALQKLWRSDPVFANLDGLVEYGEDFAADFKSAAVVRTVYRVLQGMPDGDQPPAPEAPAVASAAETSVGTVPPPAVNPPEADKNLGEPTHDPDATASGRTVKDGLG